MTDALPLSPAGRAPLSGRWASLLRAAIVVGGLTATAKAVALLKDSLVASRYGAGADVDAFLLALVVPGFMISVAAGSLPAALTPTYIAVREREGAPAAGILARAVFASTLRWLVVCALLAGAMSLAFNWLPGSQLAPSTRSLLPLLAASLAPYTLLQGMCAAWSGLLAAEHAFVVSALAPIAQPVGMVVAVLFNGWFARGGGVEVLVMGLIAGTVVQGMILARALRVRDLPTLAWRVPSLLAPETRAALRRIRAQYVPAVAGALLMSATTVTDQAMAAWLPSGSVSALGYGTKLTAVMMSVGAMALSTTLLPHLSELVAREDWPAIRLVERRALRLILATTIPATLLLVAVSEPLVRLAFQRGAFSAADTQVVAQVQSAYLLQLPVHLLGILYVRLISALSANRLLTLGSAVNLTLNIALNIVFMRWFGVVGIALSTAGVYASSCVFLGLAARRRLAVVERESLTRRAHARVPGTPEIRCASAA